MSGLFVAFCGGEGSGKSTQLQLLADYAATHGIPMTRTREPGGTPLGQRLRSLLLATDTVAIEPMAELLLMVADRVQHLAQVIRPALKQGHLVLCDRYVGSTLAIQGNGRGLDRSIILDLHRRACGDLWPDLTIVLDIDPSIGIERSREKLAERKLNEGRFEALDLDFHRRVREGYLESAENFKGRYAVVDADRHVDEVHHDILDRIAPRLEALHRRAEPRQG